MKEKRKYTKRSDYWNQFNQPKPIEDILNMSSLGQTLPETAGESFYVQESTASTRKQAFDSTGGRRRNAIHMANKKNK